MKKILFPIFLGLSLIALGPQPTATAREINHHGPAPRGGHPVNHRDYNFRRPFHYYHSLPRGYLTLKIANEVFYYLDGMYYRYTPAGYVVVTAPRGAMVPVLPPYYRQIPYEGKTYVYYNSTYYVQEPAGYTVVTPPPQVVTQNPVATEAPEKTIVVTVPNPNGSYIPVTLEKYSDGYKGPNGEFYPDYPSIDQLKAMYAKASAVAERPFPDVLDFNVPNRNGSFTKITLTRTKDGYVGPEGEYYKEKPTMDQLKIMYAK
ncbi:MAG: hypothetical protein KTQ49_03890 [Candidatus Omnitrophica bacterium]|nr:hypothetical protein [Candidatus Omnitrophota bacterium]